MKYYRFCKSSRALSTFLRLSDKANPERLVCISFWTSQQDTEGYHRQHYDTITDMLKRGPETDAPPHSALCLPRRPSCRSALPARPWLHRESQPADRVRNPGTFSPRQAFLRKNRFPQNSAAPSTTAPRIRRHNGDSSSPVPAEK